MRQSPTLIAGALLLSACSLAHAMDYGEFSANLKTDAGRAAIRVWLDGFGNGIGIYEIHQAQQKRDRRFCLPPGVRFSPELLAGIIDEVARKVPNSREPKNPVSAMIWAGLEDAYPCRPSKQM